MARPADSNNTPSPRKDIDLSEDFPDWGLTARGRRKSIKPKLPQDYITKEDRNVAGFDPWASLQVASLERRQFEGRLEPEVPAGTYVCKPLFARLVTLPDGTRPSPYYCLVLVVAIGLQRGKLIAQYWPYPGEPWDLFERDCRAMGMDSAWFDDGCTFESGAILVRVDQLRRNDRPCKEVAVITKLSSALPEQIWPTAADKSSVRRAREAMAEVAQHTVAAAAALYGTRDEPKQP